MLCRILYLPCPCAEITRDTFLRFQRKRQHRTEVWKISSQPMSGAHCSYRCSLLQLRKRAKFIYDNWVIPHFLSPSFFYYPNNVFLDEKRCSNEAISKKPAHIHKLILNWSIFNDARNFNFRFLIIEPQTTNVLT